jgi:hypothetical protein
MGGKGVSRLAREFITALCQFPIVFLSPHVESHHVQISWEQFKGGQVLRNGLIGIWESGTSHMTIRRLLGRDHWKQQPHGSALAFRAIEACCYDSSGRGTAAPLHLRRAAWAS